MGMWFQTGDVILDIGGIPDMGCGMGFQTWGWGSRQRMGFLTWGEVSDRGCGTRHRWGSRHGMIGYQTDDGVSVRGNIYESPKWNSSLLDFYTMQWHTIDSWEMVMESLQYYCKIHARRLILINLLWF